MRYLLLSLIILSIPFIVGAVTGEQIRFDFTQGQPAVTDNATSACNNQSVARFDFTSGQPSVVFDATATCTATVGDNFATSTLKINYGTLKINYGAVIIK